LSVRLGIYDHFTVSHFEFCELAWRSFLAVPISLAVAPMNGQHTQTMPYDDHESSHPTIYPQACASLRRDHRKSARAPRICDTTLHAAGAYTPIRIAAAALVILLLAACGNDGSTSEGSSTLAATPTAPAAPAPAPAQTKAPPTPQTVTPVSAADAARLLEQATFGVTAADIARVQSIGIDAYIDEQMGYAPTQYVGYSYTPHGGRPGCSGDGSHPPDASTICARDEYAPFEVQRDFFTHALNNPDQLRQRVAFALSQIMVISGIEIYEAYGLANYQNLLLKDTFGNYRTLLQDVTLSPIMGRYLDMATSDKTNPKTGTVPNQNYAREVLQLFSIGLVALNPDGTPQLDASGAPIPTYDAATIEGFSAAFTGWTYAPLSGMPARWSDLINYQGTMVAFPAHHDAGTKVLLNGYTIPANQTPAQDLADALDNIFNHPNVGPFISQQLIQHLVTSNPTPAYVGRVAAVFANNGQGIRGDLGAVVRAILTDPEARGPAPATSVFGHLREPALFITSALRSLGGQSDGVLLLTASLAMGEPIYCPDTVFSYYSPTNQIPGTQTLAPEFGIDNAATALARANFINTLVMAGGASPDATVAHSTGTSINLSSLRATRDNTTLIAQLNQTLMHGSLSSDASNTILTTADAVAASSKDPLAPARVAAYLILTSAQYQVER